MVNISLFSQVDIDSLSSSFRARRNIALRAFISGLAKQRRPASDPFHIIDLGGRPAYWDLVGSDFLDEYDIKILCVNYSESELTKTPHKSGRIDQMVGDARNLSRFADNSFDLVHSNSVIEHVGQFSDMEKFAKEVLRLSPCHYVQTPYFWFPIDPHYPRMPLLHWMPRSARLKFMRKVPLRPGGPYPDMHKAMLHMESSVMLDRAQFRYLFPTSRHRFESFLGWPKSMIAERGRGDTPA